MNGPPCIVFLSSSSDGYGGENALLSVIELQSPAYEMVVVMPNEGPLSTALGQRGVATIIEPLAVLERKYFHPLRIFLLAFRAMVSTCRLVALFIRVRPDIVHTNNVLILPGALAAWILRIPHVWHIREVIERHHIPSFLWRIWRWFILSFSDRVICVSSAVRQQFGDSDNVGVIHDGLNTQRFTPATSGSTSRLRKKSLVVGIVGRLDHRRKGQDLFVEAANLVLKENPEMTFIIVGHEREGLEHQELRIRQMVQELGHEKRIHFRGYVPYDQMASLYHELDVLVLCSKQPEGLSIVLLEAMACGKAVVSFAEGGPLDILRDHVNGLLTPPGDVRGLARAILELDGDPLLRSRIGVEGRNTVEEFFRSDHTSYALTQVYTQILKERNLRRFSLKHIPRG